MFKFQLCEIALKQRVQQLCIPYREPNRKYKIWPRQVTNNIVKWFKFIYSLLFIGQRNFEIAREWLISITKSFQIGPLATQVSVIQYTEAPSPEFDLNDYATVEEVSNNNLKNVIIAHVSFIKVELGSEIFPDYLIWKLQLFLTIGRSSLKKAGKG